MTAQGWHPELPGPSRPDRFLALLAAVGLLTVITPVLAVVSFYAVGYSMELLLDDEDACRTYACGIGTGFLLMYSSFGWMCVSWIGGLVTATLATRKTVSVGRAVVAALLTALGVTVIAVVVGFAWVVLSV
ncbi:hypothetical protein [Nocardioides sp.]|uniref:hypothetical protein n=1 Tax=Nocardioides sp. TaxID=35761 RepID=UPI002C12781A|nr:hypothetical protein [Nocardioides sp.]HXH81266.1 hypothetical protein [Nocardioides sp.]